MRSRRLSSLLLLLALTCCSRTPSDQLKTELQTVTSWTATARMVGETWLRGAVPHAYAKHTLLMAETSLQEATKALEQERQQLPEGASALHASIVNQSRSTEQLINQMRVTIEKRDGEALFQLLKQLERDEQVIKALARSGGVQP